MLNMQKNKIAYDKYLQQYNTQKKIQRPSDDPTIAVRALKYRTTLAEIEQFQRNIEDATSWMDATETAIKDVDKVMDSMVEYVTQAAPGTVNAKDREDINKQLDQYAQYIYEQDMNADYAGRYLFTGYRTDSALLFDKAQDNVTYTIHEQLEVSNVRKYDYVYGRAEIGKMPTSDTNVVAGKTYYTKDATTGEYTKVATPVDSDINTYYEDKDAQAYANEAPKFQSTNRILVSYQDLIDKGDSLTTNFDPPVNEYGSTTSVSSVPGPYIVFKDKNGNEFIKQVTIKRIEDDNVYNEHLQPGADDVFLIPETGELVFGDDIYDTIRGGSDLAITYQKKEFDKNDIKPEHYFVCEALDSNGKSWVYNTDKENLNDGDLFNNFTPRPQDIKYQINFSQTIKVNTEGFKAVGTIVGRSIEDIKNSCNELDIIEARMSEVVKRISDLDEGADADEIANLTELKSQLQTQMDLQKSVLVKSLGAMITTIQGAKDKINVALADHGSRYNRMVMTRNKIEELEIDTNQAKSDNEDADIGEAYINFTESNLLYQATLNATSKVLGQSLLDFI